MYRAPFGWGAFVSACCLATAVLLSPGTASAGHKFRVLYTFCPRGHCRDGYFPESSLIADSAGNLYGTTRDGGIRHGGVVYKLAPDGSETVVHAFTGGSDGKQPFANLIADGAGNLYGTAMKGGSNPACRVSTGCGIVFELSPDAAKAGFTETVLYAFAGGEAGRDPGFSGLLADAYGNFFGTTLRGGDQTCRAGCGTIFELAPDGTETVLHAFQGSDGDQPNAGVIADRQGNLYGTTRDSRPKGCGTVVKLAPGGILTVLHRFSCKKDGGDPLSTLIIDSQGNLFGTTEVGGSCKLPNKCGVIFKLSPDGSETVVHTFTGRKDGATPIGGLIADASGNLYGTAAGGGDDKNGSCFDDGGCGVLFELAPDGHETVLHTFHGTDGASPTATLMADAHGNLYGTTQWGGYVDKCFNAGCGTVFEVQK